MGWPPRRSGRQPMGGEFIEKIRLQLGLKVEVITGEEEGRLIYLGVKNSVVLAKGKNLILDIGGGSIEFILVDSQQVYWVKSLKLGSARLYEKFLKKVIEQDGDKKAQKKELIFQDLEKFLRKKLKPVVSRLASEEILKYWATSGTFQNLAQMSFFLDNRASNNRPRDLSLEGSRLQVLYAQLKNSTLEERAKMKGLDSRRVDIILSGAGLAWVLMDELKISSLQISDAALREGLIYQVLQKNRRRLKAELEIPNVRLRSVLGLAHKCEYGREHAHQVAKLSLILFDKLKELHKLKDLDRELLQYAALLHDIGYYISFHRHHQHAYYLIKNSPLAGFSEQEVEILALTARYHRKSIPKASHEGFLGLSAGDQERVRWLAAMLRLGDALDRSHFSVVDSVSLRVYKDQLLFTIQSQKDAEYELWEAERKSDLLSKMTKRSVIFKRATWGRMAIRPYDV